MAKVAGRVLLMPIELHLEFEVSPLRLISVGYQLVVLRTNHHT